MKKNKFIIVAFFIAVNVIAICFSLSKKKSQKVEKQVYNIDTLLLAKIMYSECSICPISEKLLAGSVVLNRVRDGRWGRSISEVVFCENQFHGTTGDNWTFDRPHYQLARFLMVYGPIDTMPLYFYGKTNKQFVNKLNLLYKEKYHIFAQ